MQLAFISATAPDAVDETLRRVVRLLADGRRHLAGVVPHPTGAAGGHPCDMDLIDLASGARMPIHQALGAGSTGCRLDQDALEAMVAKVESGMATRRAELLIVNRFGKTEAVGRGFAPLIARTLEADIPVLVGVNNLNRPAFDAFASGLARELPDDAASVMAWLASRPGGFNARNEARSGPAAARRRTVAA
jgi:hypothetical protein